MLLEKVFFKLMKNANFGKTMENLRKHRDINRKKKELVSIRTKLPYYKILYRISISNKVKKVQILMINSIYIGLSILDLSKILMYEFWYDYVKPKYGEKSKLC